jgi:hypothetical protein
MAALETQAIREKHPRFGDEVYPGVWSAGNDGAPKTKEGKFIWDADAGYVHLEVRTGDSPEGELLGYAYYPREVELPEAPPAAPVTVAPPAPKAKVN